jgi:uncharacterized membrane protein
MKKYFLTGLATLLPLAVTVYVVLFIVRFLTRPFMGIVTHLLHNSRLTAFHSETLVRTLSQLLIIVALFLFTLALGVLAQRLFFHWVLKIGDQFLQKIPLVNKVYKIAKELIRALFGSDQHSFQQVVMLPFPSKGIYALGLIIKKSPKSAQEEGGERISVFLPNAPNPMTGFLILCPKSDLIYLDMTSEEAIKYVVSCGVMQPGEKEAT